MKNIAFIPARIGSTRLVKKALAKIRNETLLSIAIKKAILSNSFDEIILKGVGHLLVFLFYPFYEI